METKSKIINDLREVNYKLTLRIIFLEEALDIQRRAYEALLKEKRDD